MAVGWGSVGTIFSSTFRRKKPSTPAAGKRSTVLSSSPSYSNYDFINYHDPYTIEKARLNATVSNCIHIIAQGIGQLPWTVWDNEDKSNVCPASLQRILKTPNTFQTKYHFILSLVDDLLFYGNAFVYIRRDEKSGIVTELVPIPPRDLEVNSNQYGYPIYRHDYYGTLTSKEVIHVRDLGLSSLRGASRISIARARIQALDAADQLMIDTFNDGVSITVSIESAEELGSDTLDRIDEAIQSQFGKGGDRRSGAIILDNGATLKSHKGITPADADLRELRDQLIGEVAAMFRVPAVMVGGSGNQTYNNYTATLASMYRDTYAPIITSIEQAFTLSLLDGDKEFRFDASALTKGDLPTQVKISTDGVKGGILTPNEAREFIGYPTLEDESADTLSSPSMGFSNDDRGDRSGEMPTDDGNMADTSDLK